MNIQKIAIERLKAAEYNPRIALKAGDKEYEKLKRSIQEFGFVEPIVWNVKTGNVVGGHQRLMEPIIWNSRTGNVVGGHQRLKVLKCLGYAEADCVAVDLDEQKEKALNIALNRISGEWDETLLSSLLKDLELSGYDLSFTGFDMTEVKDLFGSGGIENAHEDGFDGERALDKEQEPVAQTGDIWLLGKHRLLCGDCTKPEEVARLMDGRLADITVTDPPYNVNYEELVANRNFNRSNHKREESHISNDHLKDGEFYEFLLAFYKTAYGAMKGGAVLYVFHSSKESANFITAMRNAGFKCAQTLIWVKNHFNLGRQDYQWRTEPILYGWKEQDGCPHYFIDDRSNANVFEDLPLDIKKLTKKHYDRQAKNPKVHHGGVTIPQVMLESYFRQVVQFYWLIWLILPI